MLAQALAAALDATKTAVDPGRTQGDQVDHAAGGAAAIKTALRAFHYLETREPGGIEEAEIDIALAERRIIERDAVEQDLGVVAVGTSDADAADAAVGARLLGVHAAERAQQVDGVAREAAIVDLGPLHHRDAGGGAAQRGRLAFGGDDDGVGHRALLDGEAVVDIGGAGGADRRQGGEGDGQQTHDGHPGAGGGPARCTAQRVRSISASEENVHAPGHAAPTMDAPRLPRVASRGSGRSPGFRIIPSRPFPFRMEQWLRPRQSPVTVAGPRRYRTGFPILPGRVSRRPGHLTGGR